MSRPVNHVFAISIRPAVALPTGIGLPFALLIPLCCVKNPVVAPTRSLKKTKGIVVLPTEHRVATNSRVPRAFVLRTLYVVTWRGMAFVRPVLREVLASVAPRMPAC